MLSINNLQKSYGLHQALKSISLQVNAGEIYCLLGANGAGKSTTLNILLQFTQFDEGQVLIGNQDILSRSQEARQQIAYIPEIVMLYPLLDGIENLNFFSKLAGYRYTVNELQDLLLRCGLQAEAHHQRVQQYSKGMRQKVGIAIALAKKAGLLIMDEPTSGLDPRAVEDFSSQVKNYAAGGGAVLMATHDIFNAVALGTHIGIMRRGELVHTLPANSVTAIDLQKIYLETIE